MPAKVVKRDDKYRVVEPSGRLVRRNGSVVDSGGHDTRQSAEAQARAINANNDRKRRRR
jgi:hypothetical protein